MMSSSLDASRHHGMGYLFVTAQRGTGRGAKPDPVRRGQEEEHLPSWHTLHLSPLPGWYPTGETMAVWGIWVR